MSNTEKMSKKATNLVWFLTQKESDSGDFYKPILEEYFNNEADKVSIDEILNLMFVNFDYIASTPEPEDYEDEHISPKDIQMACEYLNDLQATIPHVGSGLPYEIPQVSDVKKPYILEAANYMLSEVKELIRSYDE